MQKQIQLVLNKDSQVPVRIGIHLGEIVEENDKIYGDAVNIASRIEASGHAGTILFSDKIWAEIKNDPSLVFQSVGRFKLKNIKNPIELFALIVPGLPDLQKDQLKKQSER